MTIKKDKFSNTAIVIGAGAHVPYKFPTAQDLTKKIIGLVGKDLIVNDFSPYHRDSRERTEKIAICRYMQKFGLVEPDPSTTDSDGQAIHYGNKLDEFVNSFAKSQVYSIDSYLARIGRGDLPEEQEYYSNLGKLIIAYFIRSYEILNNVGYKGFDWIQYVINSFLRDEESRDEFFKRPPKIFTFNYDTFFERSLIDHLVYFHLKTFEEAKSMVKGLNIMHIYGKMQSIESVTEEEILRKSIEDIKVIGGERGGWKLEVSKKIGADLQSCEECFFLGYGFDDLNNKMLFDHFDKNEAGNSWNSYSSNIGLDRYTVSEIVNKLSEFGVRVNTDPEESMRVDCTQLIKSFHPIFSR